MDKLEKICIEEQISPIMVIYRETINKQYSLNA